MTRHEILKEIRRIELRTRRLVNESLAGQYHSAFKGQGMNFDEVREYQPGDEVRTIDWNVTARMNHPFVKKYIEERESTVMILVDLSRSGLWGSVAESKRRIMATFAAMIAGAAMRNNDKVGAILFTEEVELAIPPRKGRRHIYRVMDEIIEFDPQKPGTDLNAALDFVNRVARHKSIVVIVSDFLGSGMGGGMLTASLPQVSAKALRKANRRHDVIAVQVADRYELELPDVGFVVLRDSETGELVEVNTGDARRRKDFAERARKRQEELKQIFGSSGIDMIDLKSDESLKTISSSLTRFFKKREKRRRHG